ncbi:MAG: ABC transporter substrate-binding protein [Armatimonadetes bacterium]|nr:ABC transporter substrate-binding protein [Armatimonadota bacterium]
MHRRIAAGIAVIAIAVTLLGGLATTSAQAPTVFRYALLGEPPHIDPHRSADFGSGTVTPQVYTPLVTLDERMRVVPLAAQSWTVSRDGLVYTFRLRDNIYFHNGRKADANDVKYSLSRLASPESRSPNARLLVSDVMGYDEVNKGQARELSGVRVIDPLTVEIRLTSPPRGDLLVRLTHVSTAFVAREAVERGGANWAETHPIGTGPWKVKEWIHRSRVEYEAFDRYFEGRPKVDRIVMPIVPEPATQLAMYQNGELDTVLVPLGDYPRIRNDPRLSKDMKEWERSQTQFLVLNPRVYAPFRDIRVRQAFAHAIDKVRVINQVFHGLYIPAAGMLPPGVLAHDLKLKGLDYNPGRARELMAEAGYPGGRGLPTLLMAVNPVTADYRMMTEPIAAMLKDSLGVNIQVQLQEFASFTAAMNRRDVLPSFMTGWSAVNPDPNYFLELWLHTQSALNRPNYNNPAFDRLIDQANAATDRVRRIAFYQQADRMVAMEAPLIPVMYTKFVYLLNPRVKGLRTFSLTLGFMPFRWIEITR